MGKKKAGGGLGRSIIRDRFAKTGRSASDGSFLHTADLNDGYDWGRLNLQSVTEQNNLEDFLATAEMAGTEFTAEKLNVTFVSKDSYTGIPQGEELSKIKGLQQKHEQLLRIPRRPPWTKEMSASAVDQNEKLAFLDWRRSLATLQEVEGILMTPYEKNLDFWRQLWRVIERSDVVVQIVDARNPKLFYCPDLVTYVKEKGVNKQCVVLINKADYLTQTQREAWADFFTKEGIRCMFWSALEEANRLAAEDAKDGEEAGTDEMTGDSDDEDDEDEEEMEDDGEMSDQNTVTLNTDEQSVTDKIENLNFSQTEKDTDRCSAKETDSQSNASVKDSETHGADDDSCTCAGDASVTTGQETGVGSSVNESVLKTGSSQDRDIGASAGPNGESSAGPSVEDAGSIHNTAQVYTGQELLEILRGLHVCGDDGESLTTVGMVGYPNVGKSSTVNAILKMKKVPVSATPGRTKHFQTLFLDKTLMLCDCPGLVFPSFVTTKADLLVNGILSIDHMRDHVPPISLICQRLPRHILEKTYGINIPLPKEGEDPDRDPSSLEFLNSYSAMRGFMTSNGLPDCPRGARIVLKDYVNGKLLFCQPPPGKESPDFNVYPEKDDPEHAGISITSSSARVKPTPPVSKIDKEFFSKRQSTVHTRTAQSGNFDAEGKMTFVEKPWKKHNNRKKKEKLRRVYAHLDKADD